MSRFVDDPSLLRPAFEPRFAVRRLLKARGGVHDARAPDGVLNDPPPATMLDSVMHEEEIPVGGIRVDRRYQLARGADGRVYVWVGRRKVPSGGPMRRTPLRFDTLTGWSPQR